MLRVKVATRPLRVRVASFRLSCRERLTFRANSGDGVVTEPAPGVGMTTENKRPGAPGLVAFEVAIQVVAALRGVVGLIRKHDADLAKQMVRAASSIAANVAEGSQRVGRDRNHLFRIAAGSAEETRAHLRVAEAWGYVQAAEAQPALELLDRELRLLWGLTR